MSDDDDDEEEGEDMGGGLQLDAPDPWCTKGELFKAGSAAGDVVQGALGDCWFLGALSGEAAPAFPSPPPWNCHANR